MTANTIRSCNIIVLEKLIPTILYRVEGHILRLIILNNKCLHAYFTDGQLCIIKYLEDIWSA